jgi:hypothetical protein
VLALLDFRTTSIAVAFSIIATLEVVLDQTLAIASQCSAIILIEVEEFFKAFIATEELHKAVNAKLLLMIAYKAVELVAKDVIKDESLINHDSVVIQESDAHKHCKIIGSTTFSLRFL